MARKTPFRRTETGKRRSSETVRGRPVSGVARASLMLVAFVGMVAFAVLLARLTLAPSAASASMAHTNLHPGESIRNYLAHPVLRTIVQQIGGNILLGVPFGILLPMLVPSARGLVRAALATALVMFFVELLQGAIVTGRAFDVDDVILNTSGAILGYLALGRRLGRTVHHRRPHWWHRWTKASSAVGSS
jgi:glycopeptide antibiotics resistance protein